MYLLLVSQPTIFMTHLWIHGIMSVSVCVYIYTKLTNLFTYTFSKLLNISHKIHRRHNGQCTEFKKPTTLWYKS